MQSCANDLLDGKVPKENEHAWGEDEYAPACGIWEATCTSGARYKNKTMNCISTRNKCTPAYTRVMERLIKKKRNWIKRRKKHIIKKLLRYDEILKDLHDKRQKKPTKYELSLKTQDYNRNFNRPFLLMDNIRWSRPSILLNSDKQLALTLSWVPS